jgi:hypothetical protein
VHTYLLRVWLPDRPGALGAVASRLGSVGADVLGIEVLERGADRAVDELLLALPDTARTELLLAELAEVDGVAVEDLREVPDVRAERGVDLLELLADLSLLPEPSEVPVQLLAALGYRFDLDWAAIVDTEVSEVRATFGDPPTSDWLVAYAVGAASSEAPGAALTRDVAIGRVDVASVLLAGRARYELHERERRELEAVARLSGVLVGSRHGQDALAVEGPPARALDGA